MTVSYDFQGKVVLVTGGASGIGRATAQAFAAAGATVAIADISTANGELVAEEIRRNGGAAKFYKVNVASESDVIAAIDAIVEEFGRLDIAHNNAGIEADIVPLAELSSDNWRRVLDVNLSSVFYCLKAEISHMLKRGGGTIVNTASASGLIGGYRLSAYTATKHGVVGLTKAAAIDYADKGIRINAICPGPIDTPFLADMPAPMRDRLLFGTPIGRLGQPEEMAKSVLWLCSEDASYVTGHSLSVDGAVAVTAIGTRMDDLFGA
ncbi:glucose 1-dehydrogenase [Rhizobium pusense]|uniref:SDR family NAD(P)-dependent oxidoreductase n=1 Tax=Agrobacterium pusense TaxID=648995 RepID=UPI000D1B23D4|nr:glucose 1-dehydrogenase [Agrobacterium pusense]MDH0910494.1 glucose 1-dehydrogenase [Agrobacterium pusense]MDH1098339.1 glucose 1-dehydrogenase [Agrobacterium pusense]MDH1114501.1 glucose 1-dehydrogenase [Agrobacterium pusense]MDH2195735.1 glucose 1-dehydrogenase [Agrobacterium pusense]